MLREVGLLHRPLLNIGLGKPTSLLIILLGEAPPFLLHNTEAGAAFQGIMEHDIDPPYELLLQHNANIFGKHAAG